MLPCGLHHQREACPAGVVWDPGAEDGNKETPGPSCGSVQAHRAAREAARQLVPQQGALPQQERPPGQVPVQPRLQEPALGGPGNCRFRAIGPCPLLRAPQCGDYGSTPNLLFLLRVWEGRKVGWKQLVLGGGAVYNGQSCPSPCLLSFSIFSAPRMSMLIYRFVCLVCLSVSPTRARSLAFVHFVHPESGVPGPERALQI